MKRDTFDWLTTASIFAGLLNAMSACGSVSSSSALASDAAGHAGTAIGDPAAAGAAGRASAVATGGNRFDTTTSATPDVEASRQYDACISYTRAQCQRRFVDCGEQVAGEDPCSISLDHCPDLAFSAGTPWTVESLLSCSEAWKTFSCDEIRQNKRPACAQIRGTRQLNEPCLFPNQCASGFCARLKQDGTGIAGYPDCGVCGTLSELGGPCDVPGYDCAPELTCGAARTCVAKAARGVVGASCTDDSTCGGYGISCRAAPADGVKRCLTWPVAGESCTEDSKCADGSLCSANLCVAAPSVGQSCGVKGPAQCATGLACSSHFDAESYVCITPRELGEVCVGEARRAPRGSCEIGLRCDCGELECDLKSGVCRQARGNGDSCADKNSVCVPGTACVDGTCRAFGPQAALSKLCPQ